MDGRCALIIERRNIHLQKHPIQKSSKQVQSKNNSKVGIERQGRIWRKGQ